MYLCCYVNCCSTYPEHEMVESIAIEMIEP